MFRINCSIDPIHFFVGAIACQTKPASLDVAKRTFYLSDQRIRTLYHYGEGRITRESAMHYKDRHLNAQAAAGGDAAPSKGGTVDEIAEDLQTVLASERDTLRKSVDSSWKSMACSSSGGVRRRNHGGRAHFRQCTAQTS